MQFESFNREDPKINLSPLIDVVFILLIFIVLAANFDRIREMNVVLPTAEQTHPATAEALVLTIPLDGPLLIDDTPVPIDDLERSLRIHRQDFDVLLLLSDGRVNMERVIYVFDTASKAGFQSVSIATRDSGS